jgi:hypothetical protein
MTYVQDAEQPPDDRLDGPVHTWFGLTYSNYQVLPRTLMQSMPVEWQERMVACLEELYDAFSHIEQPDTYQVAAAEEREYGSLSDTDMQSLGVTGERDVDGEESLYYDADGTEHEPWDRVLLPRPGGDPIPRYDRGRTYIPPRTEVNSGG